MIEEIRRQNDNLRKLQETRLLIREINPRGDGAINGCANDAIMALRDGRVALDKVLELKRSLGALVTNADPDNEG
jgi:hypothetical protein